MVSQAAREPAWLRAQTKTAWRTSRVTPIPTTARNVYRAFGSALGAPPAS